MIAVGGLARVGMDPAERWEGGERDGSGRRTAVHYPRTTSILLG